MTSKLRSKVMALIDPNKAVRVKRGHLLKRVKDSVWVKRPGRRYWEKYGGDFGYAGPYMTRKVGLPLQLANQILEGRMGGRVRFRYGKEPIYLEREALTTRIRSAGGEFELTFSPKSTRNMELALRGVIVRLESLFVNVGTYYASKDQTDEE